jgi:NTP pyrophosphatase (non-canonical NTP hydrolase)
VEIKELVRKILRFRDARDWGQFHTPKNLAAALSVEVAELQELMLWKSDSQTLELVHSEKGNKRIQEEIADVLIYALLLAHEVGIDPAEAIRKKLIQNAAKYPVSLARGNATKYSEFRHEQTGAHQPKDRDEGGAETDAIVQCQIALFPEEVPRVN